MKPVIRLLAIFAIIFLLVNYAFKIMSWFAGSSNKTNKPVDQNRNVHININQQPKVGSNKGDYIDYEEVTDIE